MVANCFGVSKSKLSTVTTASSAPAETRQCWEIRVDWKMLRKVRRFRKNG
jgi:hypothetical protein